ncbi:hypothetical protein ACLOJK_037338, partial [Asimina triloba]
MAVGEGFSQAADEGDDKASGGQPTTGSMTADSTANPGNSGMGDEPISLLHHLRLDGSNGRPGRSASGRPCLLRLQLRRHPRRPAGGMADPASDGHDDECLPPHIQTAVASGLLHGDGQQPSSISSAGDGHDPDPPPQPTKLNEFPQPYGSKRERERREVGFWAKWAYGPSWASGLRHARRVSGQRQ